MPAAAKKVASKPTATATRPRKQDGEKGSLGDREIRYELLFNSPSPTLPVSHSLTNEALYRNRRLPDERARQRAGRRQPAQRRLRANVERPRRRHDPVQYV